VINKSFIAHKYVVSGANFAGKAINIAKTTAPHAFSYYFTSHFNLRHGHAVALTLGNVFDFNFINSKNEYKDRMVNLIKILSIDSNPGARIKEFIKKLNVEIEYYKLGIDINKEIERIIKEVNTERLSNNPVKINKKDIKNILLQNI
jgi:alcohol dehydrogenase class IV